MHHMNKVMYYIVKFLFQFACAPTCVYVGPLWPIAKCISLLFVIFQMCERYWMKELNGSMTNFSTMAAAFSVSEGDVLQLYQFREPALFYAKKTLSWIMPFKSFPQSREQADKLRGKFLQSGAFFHSVFKGTFGMIVVKNIMKDISRSREYVGNVNSGNVRGWEKALENSHQPTASPTPTMVLPPSWSC